MSGIWVMVIVAEATTVMNVLLYKKEPSYSGLGCHDAKFYTLSVEKMLFFKKG